MKMQSSQLVLRQLDEKIKGFSPLQGAALPKNGWIHTIRTTLNMSLRQLGKKLSVTPQSIKHIEDREKEGTVTLKTMQAAAEAMDMKLVYGFVPKNGSLEKMIELKAYAMAEKIVRRTSVTMQLENQGNSDERLQQAINELAYEIKTQMPKQLWD